MTNALYQLAEWAADASAERYPEQWQQAREWAKIGLVDTIGCIIGGNDHISSQRSYQAVSQWGNGPVTTIGYAKQLPAPWAALVNGASAHSLDYNAWDELTAGHSVPVMFAGLLAIAEAEGRTGIALLDAFIVGMEVSMRIGAAINLSHYHIGWHSTTTIVAIGAAAGCAKLLGLDATRIGHAISMATSQAAGFKSQFGTQMKPTHCGLSSKAGVLSAYLAQTGMTASAETLDGAWSMLTLQANDSVPGFEAALASLGRELLLGRYGIVIKPYPSCAYTHRSIDGLLDLIAEADFSAEQTATVTATIPYFNASILPYDDPQDDSQARSSMQYCLAVALQDRNVTSASFDDERIFDAATRQLMARMTLSTHPIVEDSSDLESAEPAIVTVQLKDGTRLEKRVDYARGMMERPLTKAELETKFINLAAGKMNEEACLDLLTRLWDFDQAADVAAILRRIIV